MASQALGFAELLVGGVLATMGITGVSVRDVIAGRAHGIKPINVAPVGAPAGSQGPVNLIPGQGMPTGPEGAVNPLPGWHRSRIDQGVDFYGGRKIVAPLPGKIIGTGAPGWPEGGGVLLETLTGKVIFFYEGLDPTVKVGEMVTAGEQIASGRPGGSIEVGYADRSGVPLSHAEYYEGLATKWGKKMAAWLNLIGAP